MALVDQQPGGGMGRRSPNVGFGGLTQEVVGRRPDREDRSIPVALPMGVALAAVNEFRRRRWEAEDREASMEENSATSAAKSLGMGIGVTLALNVAAAGERLFAAGVSKVLAKALGANERVFRPVGHAAALSVIGLAIVEMLRRVGHKIE